MSSVFTAPDIWSAGSVELVLLLDEKSDSVVLDALEATWERPSLDGPYLTNQEEPSSQKRIVIDTLDPMEVPTLYGVATLPNGAIAAFACHVVRDKDGIWVYLGSPTGSLGRTYPLGAFPFEGTSLDSWAREVYGWLKELAYWMFPKLRFTRGVIGWLTTVEVPELSSGSVPDHRFHGYLHVAGGELQYLPPNSRESFMTAERG